MRAYIIISKNLLTKEETPLRTTKGATQLFNTHEEAHAHCLRWNSTATASIWYPRPFKEDTQ